MIMIIGVDSGRNLNIRQCFSNSKKLKLSYLNLKLKNILHLVDVMRQENRVWFSRRRFEESCYFSK